MASLKERILDVLLSRQLLSPEQLEEALKVHRTQGGSLQKILVENKFISESDLMAAISQGLGIPPINPTKMQIDGSLKVLISREVAIQYELIPISCIGQTLTIAMADPLNVFALDTVTTMTGLMVNPMLATLQEIREAIDQYYGTGVEEKLRDIVHKTGADAEAEAAAAAASLAEADADEILSQSQAAPVVRFTDAILTSAVRMHASDLLVEPRESTVRIRYRVDGILKEGQGPPKWIHDAIVSRIKVMAELNIAEKRLPQDGHFKFQVENRLVDFRVSILPSSFGGNVCLRVLDKGKLKLDINTIGFSPLDLDRLKTCVLKPHGLILLTGPTGSGKTTTLYSLLKFIDKPDKNLVTVEDPVEFDLEGINQVNVKSDIGLTFARALRSILRQDPDTIMIGEIRDAETADMAVKSALTGHLVLSSLHTNSAAGSVVRLVNMGMEPFLINSCLMAVVGQRLVRKVCTKCSQPYHPPESLAKKFDLIDENGKVMELIRGAGCSVCFQSGYDGRVVIEETLVITSSIRELILKRAPEKEIERVACKDGMKTLREHGLEKVRQHMTSLEEVFRVTIG